MYIELKDEQTGETHRFEASGVIFGRDPARVSFLLKDKGVSSVHAKIYGEEGRFWLEDLQSSNGTFIGDVRINAPHALRVGLTFALYRYRFTVTDLLQGEEGTAKVDLSSLEGSATVVTPGPPEQAVAEAPEVQASVQTAALEPSGETQQGGRRLSETSPSQIVALPPSALWKTCKQAFAYYLAHTPKLVLSPRAEVQAALREDRVGALRPLELVAWMAPAVALGLGVQALALLVASALQGGPALTSFAVALAVMVVAAPLVGLVAGYLFHPIVAWLVSVLGGNSSAIWRSNYFVALATAVPLSQIAGALGLLVAVVPNPLAGVLPRLVSLAASLLTVYIAYRWFERFKVARWFLSLVLVVGGAAVLLTAWEVYGLASSKAHASLSAQSVSDGPSAALEGQAVSAEDGAHVERSQEAPAGVTEKTTPEGERADGAMSYQELVRKREAVEKAVEEDPTLLTRKAGVLSLYKKLYGELSRFDKTAKGKKKPAPEDKVTRLVREAEIYDATAGIVAELHRAIFE